MARTEKTSITPIVAWDSDSGKGFSQKDLDELIASLHRDQNNQINEAPLTPAIPVQADLPIKDAVFTEITDQPLTASTEIILLGPTTSSAEQEIPSVPVVTPSEETTQPDQVPFFPGLFPQPVTPEEGELIEPVKLPDTSDPQPRENENSEDLSQLPTSELVSKLSSAGHGAVVYGTNIEIALNNILNANETTKQDLWGQITHAIGELKNRNATFALASDALATRQDITSEQYTTITNLEKALEETQRKTQTALEKFHHQGMTENTQAQTNQAADNTTLENAQEVYNPQRHMLQIAHQTLSGYVLPDQGIKYAYAWQLAQLIDPQNKPKDNEHSREEARAYVKGADQIVENALASDNLDLYGTLLNTLQESVIIQNLLQEDLDYPQDEENTYNPSVDAPDEYMPEQVQIQEEDTANRTEPQPIIEEPLQLTPDGYVHRESAVTNTPPRLGPNELAFAYDNPDGSKEWVILAGPVVDEQGKVKKDSKGNPILRSPEDNKFAQEYFANKANRDRERGIRRLHIMIPKENLLQTLIPARNHHQS